MKIAAEVVEDYKEEYEKTLRVDDGLIPDPFKIPYGWLEEGGAMLFCPILLYPDIHS